MCKCDEKFVGIYMSKDYSCSAMNIGFEEYTPLHVAAMFGCSKAAEALIKLGADVNAVAPDNFTPLHYAAYGSHANIASLLLAAGADVNAKTTGGVSPLMLAI